MSEALTKLAMPKWGLSMTEGRLVDWLVEQGAAIAPGDAVAEVETEKINGTVEAPAAGTLLRRVAQPGDVVAVGGLLAVLGDAATPADQVDAFVADFAATFVPASGDETGPEPEVVIIDGQPIRYLRLGDGDDVVVLVHGFGGDMTNWLFNQQALADAGRAVIVVDLPGHGGSTKNIGSGSLDDLAGALTGLLDALAVEQVTLIGHSLGGAVAAQAAAATPGRVQALVLIAPAGFGSEINAAYINGFVTAKTRRELAPHLRLLFADGDLVTRQLVEDVLRYKRLDGTEAALTTIAGVVFADGRQAVDVTALTATVDVPLLVIWGSDDQIIPSDHAAAAPAHAKVLVIAGQGHSPHMEAAGEVNRAILEFLA
jgi:pyruvate dehydrogenase E2 component (dihydrolipoamide acetyltransferase)